MPTPSLAVYFISSANTNCHSIQVNFICSKFIIDGLQQRCHMTLLFSLFVTSRNLFIAVFMPRNIITILRKISFKQLLLKGVLVPVIVGEYFATNVLKVPVKKLNISKDFTTHELFYKRLLRFPERFFIPIYRSLFVSLAKIFCIRICICKNYFFALSIFLG